MDETDRVVVDFVFPREFETDELQNRHLRSDLSACVCCGGTSYALASVMGGGQSHMPRSKMYECLGCGEYRLG